MGDIVDNYKLSLSRHFLQRHVNFKWDAFRDHCAHARYQQSGTAASLSAVMAV